MSRVYSRLIALLLVGAIGCGNLGPAFAPLTIHEAHAAEVSIDTSAHATGNRHLHAGAQTVFTADQKGYKFYRDSGGDCVYSKTTNGGSSWNTPVQIDSQTDCEALAVWYDQWTPNATSGQQTIHVVTLDSSSNNDNLFYNALDTTTDTRLTGAAATNTDPGNVQTYAFFNGTTVNYPAITKATNGTLYIAVDDASDSVVLRCTTTCGTGTNWSEAGTRPQDLANDFSILEPLTNGDAILINRDVSANVVRSKKWNNGAGAWDAAWTTIDGAATVNATYHVGMSATVASSTSAATTTIHLAYIADNATLGTDDDIRTAVMSNGVWSAGTAVTTNDAKGLTNVAIGRDRNTGDIYVAYTGRTTAGTAGTGNVYWKVSTTSMASWGTEQGPINASANDMYGVDLNAMSEHRIYATWFGVTGATIFGDTIADLVAGVAASTTGSQKTQVTASTTNFHVGGAFALTEYVGSRTVTNVTISENGTVDAQNALDDIKLLYENDTVYPYDCASVSYDGTEAQFGSTDTNGFSGADGTSAFSTGASVTVSTTSALCFYPVLSVLDTAANNATLNLYIANASTDIVVTGGGEIYPAGSVDITGSTTIYNDIPTQSHYHFRNDNNVESLATSRTGGVEDTPLTALQQSTPVRLRIEVSNEGGTTTPAIPYRLEYSLATSTCSAAYLWTNVGAAADDWDMYDSIHITDGEDTTNISVGIGGVTDENTSFIAINAGVKDTSSQTAAITATSTQFVELEYSIVASTTATEGNTYCFRVTNAGTELPVYSVYPRATIAADVNVSATSTQVSQLDTPTTNGYIGGGFVVKENSSSRTVSDITITEGGTVDGATGLDNIKLLYEFDTASPYDCSNVSYGGSETPFGATDTDGFSAANGTSTFSDSVTITTTQTLCLYVVVDVTTAARNGETIDISIAQPTTDVVVSGGGTISPSAAVSISGSTTIRGPVLTQAHYHWRNDNGDQAGATSATGGSEDTALSSLSDGTPIRLRVEIDNAGATTSSAVQYRLEYAAKVTTCSAATGWTNVGDSGGAWDMYNSPNLTDGTDTTNIAVSQGGVTDDGSGFVTPNSAVKDTSSQTASITATSTQFVELEYAIEQTENAGYSVSYCFRLTNAGTALDVYTRYPELTTAPQRDFKIQRGVTDISGTTATITAGTEYTAPSASTSAFIRIANAFSTGAGNTTGTGPNSQDADNVTAYIQNPSNILSSVTFARAGTAANITRVYWEIVEFIGDPDTDNEIEVRAQETVTFGGTNLAATGTVASGITDDADVVVFVTGAMNPNAGTSNYHTGLVTSSWASTTNEPVFDRASQGSNAVIVSYAVVEFTGLNWDIQRVEHTYTDVGVTETEEVDPVNALARTFTHAQKRVGSGQSNVDDFGHEVWLSSVGQVSFKLESTAATSTGQTSVVWVIENIQTSTGAMVVTRSDGNSTGGTEPLTISNDIGATVDTANTSIFVTGRSAGTGENFPQPLFGATIASTTHYELWRSETSARLDWRAEVVEWPVAGLAFRQNNYRLYVDNNELDPTDPWPPGGTDLGENTSITATDQPPGDGDVVRIRLSLTISNATLPTTTQAFKLQFGQRVTSCSAISAASWLDLGDAASSTAWRGYAATGTTDGTPLSGNPFTPGDLNLLESSVAGTLEEENTSASNPYSVADGQDVEYDWFAQMNGALAETTYCFRMIKTDGGTLDGYNNYPQIRTATFSPVSQNWRWYSDVANETPLVALEDENSAPIDVGNATSVKLRVTVKETKGLSRDDTRFKLQYSEYSDFSTSTHDVVATSSCTASSTWCYGNGGGSDNGVVTSVLLTDADSCVAGVGDGCGTHVESPSFLTGFRHEADAATEYEFTIFSAGPRVNRTYFFRLYSHGQELPVAAGSGETYPSLATSGADLSFTTTGIATSTLVEGVTTDVATTPGQVFFGTLPEGTPVEAAQRFSITTNATEGYQLLMMSRSPLISSSGETIRFINASNTAPAAWATACDAGETGCYGYHAGDDSLANGSSRFAPDDTYAAFETTPREVAFSSIPVVNDTVDIVYRVLARTFQPAGTYETDIVFISIPAF